MRKWNFQYRKSLLNKSNSSDFKLPNKAKLPPRSLKLKFLIGSASVVAVVLSCAMAQDKYSNQNEPGILETFVDKYFGTRYSVHVSIRNSKSPILKLSAASCEDKSPSVGVALDVAWESLRFPVEIKTTSLNSQNISNPNLSGGSQLRTFFITPEEKYSMRGKSFLSLASLKGLCEQVKKDGSSVTLDANDPFISEVKDALSSFSPDCNISLGTSGFTCEGSRQSLSILQTSAFKAQEMVLNAFQRLPYLMVRKANTLRQFATVYESENGLNGFCRVISNSMPEEQPLAFRSNLWKKTICAEKKDENWKSVAADGIELAIRELKVLTAIAEETTQKGFVSVKVPLNFRTLWVRLNPMESVAQSFQNTILRNQNREGSGVVEGFCWHPMFDENPDLQQIASGIGLFQRPDGPCEYIEHKDGTPAWKYLANALNGETSFIVDNAKGKILQLPIGSYNYKIFPMPQDPRSERPEAGPQIAVGELNWTPKTPRITLQ